MSDLSCDRISPAPNGGIYQGAFLGDTTTTRAIDAFSQMASTPVDIALKFLDFGTGLNFPTADAEAIADRGGALFIKLEPRNWGNANDRSFSLQNIINGRHDALLRQFAKEAKAFGRPIFLSFGHEMNGTWYPWSGNPEQYRRAYQHVHDVISNLACNVSWVWNPNIDFPIPDYYPGDQYVDWVAIDGYNFTGTRGADNIFSGSLDYLKTLNKPIMVGEFACGHDNTACLTDFVNFVTDPANNIRAFVYFNQNKFEEGEQRQFAISTSAERTTYREAMLQHQTLFAGSIIATAPTPAPAPTPTPTPTGAGQAERSLLYVADPEIGIMREDGRAELRLLDIADKVDLLPEDKQIEEMLLAFTDPGIPDNRVISPDISWRNLDEYHQRYPELGRIQEIDQRNYYKFYRYFFDTRTYWDNAITLLAVYVQKCLEQNQLDKMQGALDMVNAFRTRITNQKLADQASPLRISCSPSSYKLAQLGLVEAEIRSQIQSADVYHYLAGIDTTLNSIATMLSLQYNTEYPSAPDYFSLAKGILTLGNLYQQIANLTKEEKYFEAAHQLLSTLTALDMGPAQSLGLHIDLSRLFEDPLLLRDEEIDLIPNPYEYSFSYYEIHAEPGEIYGALKFNLEQAYILPEDVDNAQTGIFHYLKGVALISEANLLIAWPRVKKMDEILGQIENINRGIDELRIAAQSRRQGEEKIRYYVNAANVVKGNLFLALADRITFYNENPGLLGLSASPAEIWERLINLPEISPYLTEYLPPNMPLGEALIENSAFSSFGNRQEEIWNALISAGYLSAGGIILPKFEGNKENFNIPVSLTEEEKNKVLNILKEAMAEVSYKRSVALIKTLRDQYLTYVPEDLKYLHAWTQDKLLEIQIRLAEYVEITGQGRIANAAEMLAFAEEIGSEVEEIALRNPATEFLAIDFNYMHTTPLLLGTVFPNGDGTYETEPGLYGETDIKRKTQSYRALEVLEELKYEILTLPPALKTYFEVYIKLKEVIALVQIYNNIYRNRERTEEEDKTLREYLQRENNGQEVPQKEYKDRLLERALKLLNEVEGLTAPAIPSYLWINLTRTLPDLLNKERLTAKEVKQRKAVLDALLRFIFGTSEKIQTNRKLGQFLQQHSAKYRYENDMLMVNGQMTAEEKEALLACFTREEDKDKIEQLFRRSRGTREFPPSLIEKALALKTELNKPRVDREACKNMLNQIKEELERLNSSNQDFVDNNVEIAAWDVHSLYAELYHGFTLVYGALSKGRPRSSPEGNAFWQYAQSTYLESTRSYSPYDHNHRPFFVFKLVKFPDNTVAELAELEERMRAQNRANRTEGGH